MVDLFYGILKVETRNISNDELISVRFNMFNILELPIYYINKKNDEVNIEEILKYNFGQKKENDNQTYDITTICRLPKYLIIFFNRTVNNKYLDLQINYKENIDISPYLSFKKNHDNNYKFKLYGIMHYSTYNSKGGHYTASSLHNKKWYHFNDSYVEDDFYIDKYKNEIILMYERND